MSIASTNVSVYFGQSYEQSEGFLNGDTDGLLGLAYASLSTIPTVFDSIVQTTNMPNIFSMCFNEQGGALILGGYLEEYSAEPIQWTRVVHESYYAVELLKMAVDQHTIDSNYPLTIVDSGSTLILLPNSLYSAWKTSMQHNRCHIEGMCGQNTVFSKNSCWLFDQQKVDAFPTLHFTFPKFNGSAEMITLSLTPDMYFLNLLSTRGSRCRYLGISQSEQQMIILGDTLLQNYHTIYDKESSRVGFSRVNSTACTLAIDQRNMGGLMKNGTLGFIIILVIVGAIAAVSSLITYVQKILRRRADNRRYDKVSKEMEMSSSELP